MHDNNDRSAASTRTMELIVAALLFLFGLVVIYDSVRLGARWGEDGPQSGYFPFYIGLLICFSTAVVFALGLRDGKKAEKPFVTRGALKQVLWMLVPSAIYVALIDGIWPVPKLGIYTASTLFIAYFMRWLGRYPWLTTILVSIGVSVVFFVLFEVWFKVPLPKGLLEVWLRLE